MKLVKEKTDDNKMKNGSKSKGKPDLKIKKEVKVVVEKINKKLEVKNKKSKNIENSHQVEQYNNELIMNDLSDPNKMRIRINNVKAIVSKNQSNKWMWSPLLRTMILKDFTRRLHYNFIKNIPKPIETVKALEPLYNECLDIKINKGHTSTKQLQNFPLMPMLPPHDNLKRYSYNTLQMPNTWKGQQIDKLHVQRFLCRGLLIHLGQKGFVDVSQKTLNTFVSVIYDHFEKMCQTLRVLSNFDITNLGTPYNMITISTFMKFLSINNTTLNDISFYLMSDNKHLELQAIKQAKSSIFKMKKEKHKVKTEPILTSSQLKAYDEIPQIHVTSQDLQPELLLFCSNLEKNHDLQNLID